MVVLIRITVPVVVVVEQIALPVTVGVGGHIGAIHWVTLAAQFIHIGPTIPIIIGIRIVPYPITI